MIPNDVVWIVPSWPINSSNLNILRIIQHNSMTNNRKCCKNLTILILHFLLHFVNLTGTDLTSEMLSIYECEIEQKLNYHYFNSLQDRFKLLQTKRISTYRGWNFADPYRYSFVYRWLFCVCPQIHDATSRIVSTWENQTNKIIHSVLVFHYWWMVINDISFSRSWCDFFGYNSIHCN